jgi:DNA-binding SARP family transcriptional activator
VPLPRQRAGRRELSLAATPAPTVQLARGNPQLADGNGLPRPRLLALLPELWKGRFGLVVAPAGSGKTTLLTQFAAAAGCPVAYYCVASRHADTKSFLAGLGMSLAAVVRGIEDNWTTVDGAALSLQRARPERALLLVDDFHVLEQTGAEEALEQLLAYTPPQLGIVIASRSRPRFNWPRLLVSGALLEMDGDDLRFRSWEVERLFLDVYGEPLPPEDLADLARRTEGWAAGLQLFHLATQGLPTSERRRVLRLLGKRWSFAREYLTRNVLEGLEPELRSFLVETCVLTTLSGRLCDALLGRTASGCLLRELEARQLFTYELDDGSYRYHETLRSQLEAALVEQLGEVEARGRFRRAGELLESEALLPDALYAYCRAEAWDEVERVLGRDGHQIVDGRPVWLDVLPPGLLRNDPWLQLTVARQQRAVGRFAAATETYRAAELCSGESAAIEICRRERIVLTTWIESSPTPALDALGLLRTATIREPRVARRQAMRLATPEGHAVGGLAALLEGRSHDAAALLARARDEPDQTPAFAAAAQLGLAVADVLAGDPGGAPEARLAAEQAERAGVVWLARLAHAPLALVEPVHGGLYATAARVTSEVEHHSWGVHLSSLFEALGALNAGEAPVELLEATANGFLEAGAAVLETWTRGALAVALVRAGDPEARDEALAAERLGRRSGVAAAQALAYIALAELDPEPNSEYGRLARTLQEECGLLGLLGPAAAQAHEPATVATEPMFAVFCLGGLRLRLRGRESDLRAVTPRARTLLRLLALHEGRPVHREVLMEALWPGCDPVSGGRNLQVLVSSLRQALEPGRGRGDDTLIVRDGDAYRLALPERTEIDLTAFRRALAHGRASTDPRLAAIAYTRALDLYVGELFPEEGPAEWVLEPREQLLEEAADAARGLAEALLALGDPLAAARACRRGLALDRRDAALWRLCVAAYEAAGEPLSAARARERQSRALA